MQTRPAIPRAPRRAFALIDILLTVALIGVLAMIALPALRPGEALRTIAAANTLAADLEYAQSASLASPADPVVVRFVTKGTGYYLARAATPETPIARSNGEPYEIIYGAGLATHLEGLNLVLVEPPQATSVDFDAFGRLGSGLDAVYEISGGTGAIHVRVRASTGSVVIE